MVNVERPEGKSGIFSEVLMSGFGRMAALVPEATTILLEAAILCNEVSIEHSGGIVGR